MPLFTKIESQVDVKYESPQVTVILTKSDTELNIQQIVPITAETPQTWQDLATFLDTKI